jgi:hypothetical protein
MKQAIARETLLTYPDFNKPFEILTNASKVQLGADISQDGNPVTFYNRKVNPAQTGTPLWKVNSYPLARRTFFDT